MIEEIKKLLEEMVEDEELFMLAAKIRRKTYLALVAQGFSEEEALEITARSGEIVKA